MDVWRKERKVRKKKDFYWGNWKQKTPEIKILFLAFLTLWLRSVLRPLCLSFPSFCNKHDYSTP